MSGLNIPVRGLGPEALDAFLLSERSPAKSMMLSDLDGFLTGIAIGPEPIMPSEWLPLVWGGEAPVFADGQEAQAVLGAIMSRYNEIVREVADGSFQPILWAAPDGIEIAADWAEGFGLAVSLRPTAWDPLLKSKRHALLLFPILALGVDQGFMSKFGLDIGDEEEIARQAPAILPACVMGIAEFWRERRTPRSQGLREDRVRSAARIADKTGRNDPCPCGSGIKFKKCCGP
ncbi:MAG: UPF0149 family protein [Caulobacteraceae bacterium]|nr:UPF0149 family protein [Caulobacteraceae bacterium]